MRAGQYREQVTIQSSTTSTDAGGGRTVSWSNIGTTSTVRARVRPLSGDERIQAMQTDARATHEVRVRFRDDLTAKHRLVWRSRYLYPVGPWLNEDERRIELVALCREDTD